MDKTKNYNLPKGFILILAMLTSITPLAIDVYLPSFPEIATYFYTSIDQIEVTLSIYLFGFALGQFLGGPLSDRYGRKIFIFVGLSLYILFSFLITLSNSVETLWIFRFFQALGGGFAVVNTNAIVRDIYSGKDGAKVFSIILMVIMIAPMIAPIIGAIILNFLSWKYIFIFLSIYSLLLLYFITKLPETSSKVKSKKLFENYKLIFMNKEALFLMLASGFGLSGMFIFITKSSFIYMEYFSVGMREFTIFFALNVVTLIFFTKLNISLLQKHSSFKLLVTGVIIQLFSAIILFIFNIDVLIGVIIFIMLYIGALGFVFANAISLLLENFGHISATANALNGVVGFAISALVGFLASNMHNATLEPIFTMMLITSSISLFILFIVSKIRVRSIN